MLDDSALSEITTVGPLMRPKETAKYLGISLSTLYRLQALGDLPPAIKIGGRVTAFSKPQIDAMISARASQGGQHAL